MVGIGATAAPLVLWFDQLLNDLSIDDPVSAVAIHGIGGMLQITCKANACDYALAGSWGFFATALFAKEQKCGGTLGETVGWVYSGDSTFFWNQMLALLVVTVWGFFISFILLMILDKLLGLRVPSYFEVVGLDASEHGFNPRAVGVTDNVKDYVNKSIERKVQMQVKREMERLLENGALIKKMKRKFDKNIANGSSGSDESTNEDDISDGEFDKKFGGGCRNQHFV